MVIITTIICQKETKWCLPVIRDVLIDPDEKTHQILVTFPIFFINFCNSQSKEALTQRRNDAKFLLSGVSLLITIARYQITKKS